ncbi:hypothetical protein TELCIR_15728, partial [Teladorsagia circumcincta]
MLQMSDDEFDEAKHEKLLANVLGRKEKAQIRKSTVKISSDVLINSVKQAKKDLKVWNDVVKTNRLADQLSFPLGEERMLSTEKPTDRAEAFKTWVNLPVIVLLQPKTDFEKKMMEMWNGSKNNMTNDTVYTEAELEIIRAMDVKEAKEKLNQMQKMRALISYREAKYRYAAKIKSKREFPLDKQPRPLSKKKKKRVRFDEDAEQKECSTKDIDKLFDAAEEKIVESIKEVAKKIREEEEEESTPPKEKKKKKPAKKCEDEQKKNETVDISLDPKNFLQVETTNLSKVSAELMDKMDEFDEDQAHVIAEAFKDDDVIGDFEEEKIMVEEGERPKDVDLTLQGWGCWVGPGMTERKRRKQFIIKAKEKKRKDKNRPGVIIKEVEEK